MKTRTIDKSDPATGVIYTATFTFEKFHDGMFGDRGTTMGLESVTIDGLEIDPDMVPVCVQQYFDSLTTKDFDLGPVERAHDYD